MLWVFGFLWGGLGLFLFFINLSRSLLQMKDELRPLLLVLSHLQLRRAPGWGGYSCASELGLGRFEVKVWAGSERGRRSDLPLPWSAVLQWLGDQHLGAFAELSMGVGHEDSNKRGCKTRNMITQQGFGVSTGVTFDG